MERLKEGSEISPQKGCFAVSVHEKLEPGWERKCTSNRTSSKEDTAVREQRAKTGFWGQGEEGVKQAF